MLDLVEDDRGDEAEEADGDDADEHDVDAQQLPGIPDQIADAALGGAELGADQNDERYGEADAEPGEDHRQGAEEDDAGAHHGAAGAVVVGDVDVDAVDVGGAGEGVDDQREEDADRDEHDIRPVSYTHLTLPTIY